MKKVNYLFYRDFFVKNERVKSGILVSKIKHSFLLGPIINEDFDEKSFEKRLLSSCVYSLKQYKKFNRKYAETLIDKYYEILTSNEVLEIKNKDIFIKHKIIQVPGDENEK